MSLGNREIVNRSKKVEELAMRKGGVGRKDGVESMKKLFLEEGEVNCIKTVGQTHCQK